MITLSQLIEGIPAGPPVAPASIAEQVRRAGRMWIVLDDDPTGTQSVADLPVLTTWHPGDMEWALRQGAPAVYVMTNSRSLAPEDAERVNRDVAAAALAASAATGVPVGFVSRSDSTLRGHFPLEPDVLSDVLASQGQRVDAIILVPAFADAGRVTVHGVHYAGSAATGYVPVGQTEFAADATFGYASSDLREWVQEKSGGRIGAGQVRVLDLAMLRTSPEATGQLLRSATGGAIIAADCAGENDLLLLASALAGAEADGKQFLYRVGPPFMRARLGQPVREPLTGADAAAIAGAGTGQATSGGLIVAGSHVPLTTRQLDALRARRAPFEAELDVAAVLDPARRDDHVRGVADRLADALASGNAVMRTSRTLVTGADESSSLDIARTVSAAVVDVVRRVLAARPPRFVVAKGGITSSDVATHGLSIGRAYVRGPMLPGIVSLWEPRSGPARGIPYIVFAGNVGDDESLADVVDKLSA